MELTAKAFIGKNFKWRLSAPPPRIISLATDYERTTRFCRKHDYCRARVVMSTKENSNSYRHTLFKTNPAAIAPLPNRLALRTIIRGFTKIDLQWSVTKVMRKKVTGESMRCVKLLMMTRVDAGSLNALCELEWKAGSKGKDGCLHWLVLQAPGWGI